MGNKIGADKVKITVARLKKFGETFEIHVDPDAALEFKKGSLSNLREVLMADHIFTDAKKGQLASQQQLQQAFKTIDADSIAIKILKDGEIQATSEHRAQEREQKWKKLVYLISRQAVDPKTGLPHPPMRIELAMEQAKIHLDDHQTAEEQFDQVLAKLRPVLPIKIKQKKVTIRF
ncbi:ribosome assembly factor SBDS [Candidatus Woesearchaeota archaeon]|nr:ribosome assembly factor SBDS [Candidatus Woesearchaeota archaeon]